MTEENVPEWFDAIPDIDFSEHPGWLFVNVWEEFTKIRDSMNLMGLHESEVEAIRERAALMILAIKA